MHRPERNPLAPVTDIGYGYGYVDGYGYGYGYGDEYKEVSYRKRIKHFFRSLGRKIKR